MHTQRVSRGDLTIRLIRTCKCHGVGTCMSVWMCAGTRALAHTTQHYAVCEKMSGMYQCMHTDIHTHANRLDLAND